MNQWFTLIESTSFFQACQETVHALRLDSLEPLMVRSENTPQLQPQVVSQLSELQQRIGAVQTKFQVCKLDYFKNFKIPYFAMYSRTLECVDNLITCDVKLLKILRLFRRQA